MALHAGFAAALSVSRQAAQTFVHAAYVNNILPTIFQGSTKQGQTNIQYDMVLAEPQLQFDADYPEWVTLNIELLGTITLSGKDKPTIPNRVHMRAAPRMPVVLKYDTAGAVTLGLDAAQVQLDLMSVHSKRVSGDDATADYGFDLGANIVAFTALTQTLAQYPDQFLLTPPQFPQFSALGYKLSMAVSNTTDSLNIGLDVVGKTSGDPTKLIDLNTTPMDKGFTKFLREVQHSYDDEYGMSYYDTTWDATVKRNYGPHNTGIAVAMHSLIIADVYHRVGRQQVILAFEKMKHDNVMSKLRGLSGKKAGKSYEPSQEALSFIDELNITLADDYLHVTGVGSNYSTLAVHADFDLKLRMTRIETNGDALPVAFKNFHGITAETYDVEVSQPGWVTALEVVIGVAGVLLAPVTYGISIMAATVLDIVVGSFASDQLSSAEGTIGSGVTDATGAIGQSVEMTLPETTAPLLRILPDDVAIKANGISTWLAVSSTTTAGLHVIGSKVPLFSDPVFSESWPATKLDPIVVEFQQDGSLFNPHDPEVRIKWEVHGNQVGILLLDHDVAVLGSPNAMSIAIAHADDNLLRYDRFIVRCRIYRIWDDWTQDFFQQEVEISISDTLDRSHPYVQWEHPVQYDLYSAKKGSPGRQFKGWQTVQRKSHIHRTDPKKRCRFADGFTSVKPMVEPSYFDALSFPIGLADQHRKEICPYCFFGGPDKHAIK